MRGSLPGEKTLVCGTCWVSIRTTPAANHNFKDQHKSRIIYAALTKTHLFSCMEDKSKGRGNVFDAAHAWRLPAHAQLCIFMLFLSYVTINHHAHCKMKILSCPAVVLICHCKHTRSWSQMWCSTIVWQLSLQLPWRRGAAALALKA